MDKNERLELEINGQKQLFVLKPLTRREVRDIRKKVSNFNAMSSHLAFDLFLYQDLLACASIVEPVEWKNNLTKFDDLSDANANRLVVAAQKVNGVDPLGSGGLEMPSEVEKQIPK